MKKQNEGATSTFFLVRKVFFQIQNIYFFTVAYVEKLLEIKEYWLKSKVNVILEKRIACWLIFFYHFPAGGKFLNLTS